MKKIFLIILSAVFSTGYAQFIVSDNPTVSHISDLLEGEGLRVSGLIVNCPGYAIGEFSGTSEVPIAHGLVLTTGKATDVAGTALSTASWVTGSPGDADLENILGGVTMTYDACVLEFDCVPVGDTILFNFSFGSEEYPEYVNLINDVFAIFVSGPGISGTVNVAALPGGIPVSINNVNDSMNASYYYNNQLPPGTTIRYDGLTDNLSAFAEVIPGSSYHFKIAIADASNLIYDSGVFLEAYSFRSNFEEKTDIGEAEEKRLLVFPNPSSGLFCLSVKENDLLGKELKILNVLGQEVYSTLITAQVMMADISGQPSGIYYACVRTSRGCYRTRLLKE